MGNGHHMLRLVGSRYYFRRAVPEDLRRWLKRSEISLSLKTSHKLIARQKAALLYAGTGHCFEEIRRMTNDKNDKIISVEKVIEFYTQFIKDYDNYYEVKIKSIQSSCELRIQKEVLISMRILKRVENFIENVQPYVDWQSTFLKDTLAKIKLLEARYGTREVGFREEIANLSNILISMGTAGRTFPSPPEQNEPETLNDAQNIVALSSPDKKRGKKISKKLLVNEAAERFIFSDIGKSLDTIKSTRTTVDLFIEAFGNIPVDQVTGTTAGDFKDLLLGLPANHGKEKRRLPIRDAVQDAKERGLSTLSGKTAKNHFSRLSALWSILVQREMTTRNPWMQWNFNTAKKTERRCWNDDELSLLAETQWDHRTISQRTYAGIVMVALYTGMRLGEICNLRCQDIEKIQEVACFRICPHAEDNWSPKSVAGIRIVPIHSQLISLGIMSFVQPNQHFLFPDLPTSRDGVRGAAFGQTFSRLKDKLGLPPEVAFHGFRHTVSTKLRNQNADIRELWIDRLLGHEASHRSQGTMNYTSSIDVKNLSMVIEALDYPSLKMRIPKE